MTEAHTRHTQSKDLCDETGNKTWLIGQAKFGHCVGAALCKHASSQHHKCAKAHTSLLRSHGRMPAIQEHRARGDRPESAYMKAAERRNA